MDQQTPPPMMHPSGRTRDEVNLAMWCHLIPVIVWPLGFGLFAFLGPLIIRQYNKTQSQFVEEHAKQSFNFQISILIYLVPLGLVALIGIFLTAGIAILIFGPLFVLAVLGAIVIQIVATVKAANGEEFDYLVSIRFLK